MPMHNLIEYSSNYSDTLWQFKRDESLVINAGNPDNVSTVNSADNAVFKNVKIAVPAKYLSNFWRFLEMPLIVKFTLN